MYEEDSRFEKPENPGAKIWRYMDLAKFISLIDTSCLYFCQIDSLNDSFEGSLWPSRLLNRSEENSAKLFAEKMRSYYPQLKVNCWHIAENESAAMWKLYSEANAGIAVQSTFSGLCESLERCSLEVRIGTVRYINYDEEYFAEGHGDDIFTPFLYKRLSFEHERELRAIIWDPEGVYKPDERGGLYVRVDLKKLIRTAYVSPDSPQWIKRLVDSVCAKYELEANTSQSSLAVSPLY